MTANGFIKLPRRILEWEWFSEGNTLKVYLALLVLAEYEDCVVRGIPLKKGQALITLRGLADKTGLSVNTLVKALGKLQPNYISVKSSQKYTVVSIQNFSDPFVSKNNAFSDTKDDTKADTNSDINSDTNSDTPSLYIENKKYRSEEPSADNISEEIVVSICESFNRICESLPSIQPNIAVLHRAHLILAARQIMGEMTFEELFAMVEKSDFLCGRGSTFKASFDWILRPENLGKILSGAYSQNYSAKKKMPTAADYHESLYD